MSEYGLEPELKYDPGFEDYLWYSEAEVDEFGVNSRYIFRFPNGYGASVVKTPFSYGGTDDEWELMLIFWTSDDEYEPCLREEFIEPIGYLTDEEVNEYLLQIEMM